jgi:crotonobetainyl-CoA:carnitine CoA-transferase CaiB-like acyl-CoA transferase
MTPTTMTTDLSRPTSAAGAPLEGIVVIDTTTFLAGPFSGVMLADLGAEVIKVEPPGHDPLRRMKSRWHPASPMAANVNRNKRSIVIDMKTSEGLDEFYQLVRRADVALFNMRATAAVALGVDDATLASINDRLIRVWLTGYGPSGPLSAEPAFDSAIQAYAGIISAQTGVGEPSPMRTYVADKVSGMFMVQGVLGALFKRVATGLGDTIDVSLLDSTAYFGFPDLFEDQTLLDQDPRESVEETTAIVAATADGLLVLAPATGKQVKATLEVVGHPEWQQSLRNTPNRNALMTVFVQKLGPVLKAAPTAEWVRRFSEADVPVAPVLNRTDHLSDPQVAHNRIYGTYQHPEYGQIRAVRFPVRYGGQSPILPLPFPSPDGDRNEIIDWLGRNSD